jgi:hypothetical protein
VGTLLQGCPREGGLKTSTLAPRILLYTWMVDVSLVVGQIHDGGISLVADTKITHKFDDTWTRQVFKNALPKLMILRDNFAVGITGDNPDIGIRRLVEFRDQPVEDLLNVMANISYASFVVAVLGSSPQLWKVSAGSTEERSSVGRCWSGDHDPYEFFQQRYHEWPEKMDSAFRLMSSMQWLLSFNPVDSVGGYLTRVATTSEGFRFIADPVIVAPCLLGSGFQILPAVGRSPTAGALAYYIPQAGVSLLFCHESPWKAVTLKTNSMPDLIQSAATKHRQALADPPSFTRQVAEQSG